MRHPKRNANSRPSFYSLFNPFQELRDVFFREAQRSTCAITGQALSSNLTHHCGAGDATTKLPDILNGVLRSLALQRRANLHFLRYLLFHTSFACKYHKSFSSFDTPDRGRHIDRSDQSSECLQFLHVKHCNVWRSNSIEFLLRRSYQTPSLLLCNISAIGFQLTK